MRKFIALCLLSQVCVFPGQALDSLPDLSVESLNSSFLATPVRLEDLDGAAIVLLSQKKNSMPLLSREHGLTGWILATETCSSQGFPRGSTLYLGRPFRKEPVHKGKHQRRRLGFPKKAQPRVGFQRIGAPALKRFLPMTVNFVLFSRITRRDP